MPLRIYLDDNRPTPAGWTRAHTAEDVKVHLVNHQVEDLDLDHDLDMPECPGCNFACGHREKTLGQGGLGCVRRCSCHSAGVENGMDLLRWMHRANAWPRNKPAVHSANPTEGPRMREFIDLHWPGNDAAGWP